MQIGPDRVEQLFLGDELTGPTDEIAKNLERLRRQRDPLPASPQQRVGTVEAEFTKGKRVSTHGSDPRMLAHLKGKLSQM